MRRERLVFTTASRTLPRLVRPVSTRGHVQAIHQIRSTIRDVLVVVFQPGC
jgi:hypothetical protein